MKTISILGLAVLAGMVGCDSSTVSGGDDDDSGGGGGGVGVDASVDPLAPDGGTPVPGGPDAAVDPGCVQASSFMDVAASDGAGPGYPTPSLDVSCTDALVLIESNGIPNFEFVPITPNALTEQEFEWELPRLPAMAGSTSDVPLVGVAAIAVNGLPIFGPTEAPQMGSRDPYLDDILDYCSGHTAMGGVYHFHARPDCLFADAEGNTSLVLAYAIDGFPILAPYECANDSCTQTEELASSWRQVEEVYGTSIQNAWDAHEYVPGLGDLDECNGKTLPDGSYAYYATDTFPYFVGCYRGTPRAQPLGGGGGPGGP